MLSPLAPSAAEPTSCCRADSAESSPFTPVADEDSVVFSQLTYLGCASVNAPRSEVEALRMMAILRSQGQSSVDVTLSVPNVSEGTVRYLPLGGCGGGGRPAGPPGPWGRSGSHLGAGNGSCPLGTWRPAVCPPPPKHRQRCSPFAPTGCWTLRPTRRSPTTPSTRSSSACGGTTAPPRATASPSPRATTTRSSSGSTSSAARSRKR